MAMMFGARCRRCVLLHARSKNSRAWILEKRAKSVTVIWAASTSAGVFMKTSAGGGKPATSPSRWVSRLGPGTASSRVRAASASSSAVSSDSASAASSARSRSNSRSSSCTILRVRSRWQIWMRRRVARTTPARTWGLSAAWSSGTRYSCRSLRTIMSSAANVGAVVKNASSNSSEASGPQRKRTSWLIEPAATAPPASSSMGEGSAAASQMLEREAAMTWRSPREPMDRPLRRAHATAVEASPSASSSSAAM
mmetsp:Transcript_254/g.883  ORF Transcript_254/g.883 Transcript_254/m.883 type:complete len:253 (+) Transcript_254:626-1384(+)